MSGAKTLFARQSPSAIDAGAFHNDVVAVSNGNVLLCHELSYVDTKSVLDGICKAYTDTCHGQVIVIEISEDELSLADAIGTYLFNSQLVNVPTGGMTLISPIECQEHDGARQAIDRIVTGDNPVRSVRFVDLRQSMQNGGGPACLRLRVVLTEREYKRMHQGVVFTDGLHTALSDWVDRHYRNELELVDLADPKLLKESRDAMDELTGILGLGSIYRFQKG